MTEEEKAYISGLFDKFPCHKDEKMVLESIEAGKVVVSVRVPKRHMTDYGFLQGGYFAVYGDSPAFMALMSTRKDLWGKTAPMKKFDVELWRGAEAGDKLTIFAEYIEEKTVRGKTFYLVGVTVKKDGKILATGSFILQLAHKFKT